MTLRAICDGWLSDLTTQVPELADATQHRYASWSFETLGEAGQGRHVAVWVEPSPDTVLPATTGGLPADFDTHNMRILVWEAAHAEATRLYDDDEANGAWLDLYEAVKARLRVQANTSIGATSGYTRFTEGGVRVLGTARVMEFAFTVREPVSYT